MKAKIAILVLLTGIRLCHSQGFVNLDFEAADVSAYGSGPAFVPITNALPGWVSYLGNGQSVFYNTVALGGAAISLQGAASLNLQPLQGNYSVLLQGSGAGPAVSAIIGQTGQVPAGAASVRFWADPRSNLQVTFGGQVIPMFRLEISPGYDIFGGDISSFAGQTAELRFIGPGNSGGYFDNIFFSNQPIPEPGVFGLFTLGALLLGWRILCKRS